jgi:hypothetical protein
MKAKLSAIALILVPVTANAQTTTTATLSADSAQFRSVIAARRAAAAKAHSISAKCLAEEQTVSDYADCWKNGNDANPSGGPVGSSDGGSE